MADLPPVRVTQVKPFQNIEFDYGGPFFVTLGKSRGCKAQKAYICLFVCLATKAIHIESSETFLAALRRFIGRRGRWNLIYSDCGTNFVGSNRILNHLMHSAANDEKIRWSFNRPATPHFGGIWEAGIKSAKTHIA